MTSFDPNEKSMKNYSLVEAILNLVKRTMHQDERCRQPHHSFRMFKNVTQCFRMSENVLQCFRMVKNVTQCFRMFQNIPELLERSISL